jgi:uncharacterized protein (DUF1697 family)
MRCRGIPRAWRWYAVGGAASAALRQDERMPTHVALLRGINVGGRNKVAMSDLRELVASLGHTDVVTYIQSGNVVFTAAPGAGDPLPRASLADVPLSGTAELAAELEQAIADSLGVSARVIVLSRDDLAQAARDNPYPGEPSPRSVHAVFLSADPGPEVAVAVADAVRQVAGRGSRDTAEVIGRTIFLHTPDGFGNSDLAALLTRQKAAGSPDLTTTARNWATVTKLLALCG